MIEVRPASAHDAYELFLTMHPISRSELRDIGIDNEVIVPTLKAFAAKEGTSAGLIDGSIAFLARSDPFTEGKRSTSFLLSNCYAPSLLLCARKWGAEEHVRHPGATAISFSRSKHPKRDRFFEAFGFKKMHEADGVATFEESQR